MNAKYNQFIGMYENVFPEYFCQHLIDEFERLNRSGITSNRKQSEGANKTYKDDTHTFLNYKDYNLSSFNDKSSFKIFWDGLQECFKDYEEEYDILKDINIICNNIKIQKTDPGSGYHVWHCERSHTDGNERRELAYAIYLNDIDEDGAGETEFLYQRLRIPPKENTCIIWPAGFTHPHRGNVVYGNKSKYIITGWFHLG
jgi:hypothetical protein